MTDREANRKQDAEVRLKYYQEGLEAAYEILSGLEKYTTEEVLFYAAQILGEVLDTEDVAIYLVANREYARLFSATSTEARKLGNSIQYTLSDAERPLVRSTSDTGCLVGHTEISEVYSELKAERIYLNREGKEGRPLMAGAIYSEGEIRAILMFWGISCPQTDSAVVKRLKVMETLLQNAMLKASRYMASFRRQNYLEGTNVLNEEAFAALVSVFIEAREKGLTECTLLEIRMGYEDYETVSIQIAGNIRQTDYMGVVEGGKLYILLSNTGSQNAEVVQERLRGLGYESFLREGF